MAKKPDPAAIDALVTRALVSLATADGKRRLSKKGDYPALFPSEAGENKAAILRCKDEARPLVRVVGKGKGESVELTAAGFETILPHLPEEKVGAVARSLAETLPLTERIAFLNEIVRRTPLATAELLPVLEAATAAEKAEAEARAAAAARRRELEDASRMAIARWLDLMEERKKQRVESLRRELEAAGEEVGATLSPPIDHPPQQIRTQPPLRPSNPEESKFRRLVARRLISAWLESIRLGKPEGRRFLEVAIGNVDEFEPIDEEGRAVPFNGRYHRAEVGVSTGAQVTVIRPGWKLIEDDGEYIIEQALVKP